MTSIRADSTDIRAESIGLTLIVVILLMLASLMAGIGLKEYVGTCPHHRVVDPSGPAIAPSNVS
jgi:hypothetical protein